MSDKTKQYLEYLAQVTFLVLGLWGVWEFSEWSVRERTERRISKEHTISQRGCVLSGYYGRSGEYKTYNCRGEIVKEGDL